MKELLSITKIQKFLCRKLVRRLLLVFLKSKDRSHKSQFFPWNETTNITQMHLFDLHKKLVSE